MHRRDALLAWLGLWLAPAAGLTQQRGSLPVVGFLSSRGSGESAHLVHAFKQGLGESGFIEGKTVVIEYRWADGKFDRLPELAADLARRKVAVIATAGGTPSALAAKDATATIPIVFLSGGDLVKLGLVKSFNRPEGNATGVSQFSTILVPKRLELVRDLNPVAATVAILLNPKNPNTVNERNSAEQAAKSLGFKLAVVEAATSEQIFTAFESLMKQRADAVVVAADPFLDVHRDQIVILAARHSIPAIYQWRDNVVAGGLISYGADFPDTYRQAGIYTGRILKGAKPADLPIVQPTKFQLVVNLRTAKALGISVPQSILVRADEVIR